MGAPELERDESRRLRMADPAGDRKHPRPIEYPTSYGKPMAESDLHRDLMIYVIEALRSFFDTRPDVYVSGNNFIYYVAGDPRRCVSPDAYVVFGVPMSPRDRYCSWEEGGRLPNVVFEFTSRKTRQEDVRVKRPRYEQELRVTEYFLFDPKGDCLSPRLQGFRLVAGRYVPLELVDGRLHSEQLGLDLVQEKSRLRLFDPTRREPLLTPHEREQARRVAEEARWNAEEAH